MPETNVLKAGAGKGKINFTPEMMPDSKREKYTTILDNPSIRVILIENGERFAFVTAEVANMDRDVQMQVLSAIQEKAEVPLEHIFFHLNHVHSTPHGWSPWDRKNMSETERAKVEPFYNAILTAANEALEGAIATLREAVIGTGTGICRSCILNRNVDTAEGRWLGFGEDGPRDDSIPIVRFDDLEGNTIAIIFTYNVVPSIFDYSTRDFEEGLERPVSADIAGWSAAYVEEEFPGAVGMYCTGAAGDTWPSFTAMYNLVGRGGKIRMKDLGERAYVLAEIQGERLGQQVVIAADKIQCKPIEGDVRIEFGHIEFEGRKELSAPQDMRPQKHIDYVSCGETRTMEIPFFHIGNDIVFLGMHCQIGVRTIMKVREASPQSVTSMLSFTTVGGHDNSTVRKYMPELDAYEKAEYCAQNSVVMPGSTEKLGEYLIDFLNK